MSTSLIRQLRRAVGLSWCSILIAMVGLIASSAVAPMLGYQMFIIRGGSMEPAIPLGSLVAVQRVDAGSLTVGDVVTIQTTAGTVFTHRIVAVDTSGPERRFQLRGDANAAPDSELVPGGALVGRVAASAPGLGYLNAFLSMTTGMVSILSMLGSLLLTYWLLEDLELEEELEAATSTTPRPQPVGQGGLT